MGSMLRTFYLGINSVAYDKNSMNLFSTIFEADLDQDYDFDEIE